MTDQPNVTRGQTIVRTPGQLLAADPARHVWVAASAGTGKTHVLTDRMLRLMLEGSPPDRILALTFTRAAAAEMQNRLTGRLGGWQTLDDAALDAELLALGVPATAAMRARARLLFALALDVPGGLKVETLHAFAQGLLAAFPLEAGLPPGFRPLDERDARQLRQRALYEAISDARRSGDSGFLDDLAQLAIQKGEGGVMQTLDRMIEHAEGLEGFGAAAGFELALRRFLNVGPDEQPGERLAMAVAPGVHDDERIARFAQLMEQSSAQRSGEAAATARKWLALDAADRTDQFPSLVGLFLDKTGKVRGFKALEKIDSNFPALLADILGDIDKLLDFDRRIEAADTGARALRAGHRIVAGYARLKRAAVAIDYDDMIARTAALLGPPGVPSYIGWKLDSRFDHLLLDEAQDTNPRQWAIIGRIVEDFFDIPPESRVPARSIPEPVRERPVTERLRSLFVVGDHKQAIYGFQGTDPRLFESEAARLSPSAEASGRPLARVALDLSFRSGPAILEVVNGFLEEVTAAALGMAEVPPPHQPCRAQAPGEVVLWPVQKPEDPEGEEAGEGSGGTSGEDGDDGTEAADRVMAARLACQVAEWLKPGPGRLWLAARERFARAEDILILLRKRSWLMGALVGALHKEGVPVAGVDRLLLTEPLAVLDCLALVRFAVQPEDDLNLASLLVSPFLNWAHEEIRILGGGKPSLGPNFGHGLWKALGREASASSRAAEARDFLADVLALADTAGPYAFLDTILSGPLRGRHRLLTRLGPEANDPLDELLLQALAFENSHPLALAGFLSWIEAEGSVVKRDADAASGQVRLMTIHGSKGLEAPVVVLADSAHQRRRPAAGFVPVELDGGQRVPFYHPGGAEIPRKLKALRAEIDQRDAEEDLRLLYVGLTRAADHLYIGGAVGATAHGKLGGDKDRCWHTRLCPVLEAMPGVEHIDAPIWGPALRIRRGLWTEPHQTATTVAGDKAQSEIRTLRTDVAAPPGRPARPLTPSAMPEEPPTGPAAVAMRAAAQRGTWIHRLFERLPAIPPASRQAAGLGWLQAQGAGAAAPAILAEVLAVIDDPAHTALFGPLALAEAPIAGLVGDLAIAGTVDRLLVEPDRVLVVDFKTGLSVPPSAEAVAAPHRRQMAAYRALLLQAFPDRRVEAALLYTAGPRMILLEDRHMEGLLPLD